MPLAFGFSFQKTNHQVIFFFLMKISYSILIREKITDHLKKSGIDYIDDRRGIYFFLLKKYLISKKLSGLTENNLFIHQ